MGVPKKDLMSEDQCSITSEFGEFQVF